MQRAAKAKSQIPLGTAQALQVSEKVFATWAEVLTVTSANTERGDSSFLKAQKEL